MVVHIEEVKAVIERERNRAALESTLNPSDWIDGRLVACTDILFLLEHLFKEDKED